MPATLERIQSEQIFHDRQAEERGESFRTGRADLRFDDADYLNHETWIRPAFAQLGDVRGKAILDYGCGHGMAAVVLARAGARARAFDLSPGYVAEAKLRAAVNGVSVDIRVADAEHLPYADASFDADYAPDRVLADGEGIAVDGLRLVAVATPGHTSNHLCFALEGGASDGALFTGDHVMGWSTTVVFPPDGDMGDYMASLDKLRQRKDRIYYPAHGPAVTKPAQLVRGMIGHRMQRERQILKRLGDGDRTIGAIVASSYPGLDRRLVPAAGGSVTAHLMDLTRRGLVEAAEDQWTLTNPKY